MIVPLTSIARRESSADASPQMVETSVAATPAGVLVLIVAIEARAMRKATMLPTTMTTPSPRAKPMPVPKPRPKPLGCLGGAGA